MKGFSIRKSNQPDPLVEGYDLEDKPRGKIRPLTSKEEEYQEEQPSNLTAEEEEMLKPRDIKVVNPWIKEQTHKEYLEQVKVRHYFSFLKRVFQLGMLLLFKSI